MIALFFALTAYSAEPLDAQISRALSARDAFVGCDALWGLGDAEEVQSALIAATTAARPPWLPMRAGACVAERAAVDDVAWKTVQGWMTDPAVPGLALVALDKLDNFPEPRAIELADMAVTRIAIDSKFARHAPDRLANSSYASVRAKAP